MNGPPCEPCGFSTTSPSSPRDIDQLPFEVTAHARVRSPGRTTHEQSFSLRTLRLCVLCVRDQSPPERTAFPWIRWIPCPSLSFRSRHRRDPESRKGNEPGWHGFAWFLDSGSCDPAQAGSLGRNDADREEPASPEGAERKPVGLNDNDDACGKEINIPLCVLCASASFALSIRYSEKNCFP